MLGAFYLSAMRKADTGYTLRQLAIATLCVAAYGVSDEIHQHFVPGRNSEIMDVVADTAGGLLATILMRFARQQIKPAGTR